MKTTVPQWLNQGLLTLFVVAAALAVAPLASRLARHQEDPG